MANAKSRLVYLFDSTGTDVSSQVSNFTIEAADADGAFLSYAAARSGGDKDYVAKFTIPQDYSTGSLWTTMATQKGTTWTGYYTASVDDLEDLGADAPAWEFNAIVSIPNGVVLGGETSASANSTMTVELEWMLIDFDPVTSKVVADPVA
jgi:hypothetical protein